MRMIHLRVPLACAGQKDASQEQPTLGSVASAVNNAALTPEERLRELFKLAALDRSGSLLAQLDAISARPDARALLGRPADLHHLANIKDGQIRQWAAGLYLAGAAVDLPAFESGVDQLVRDELAHGDLGRPANALRFSHHVGLATAVLHNQLLPEAVAFSQGLRDHLPEKVRVGADALALAEGEERRHRFGLPGELAPSVSPGEERHLVRRSLQLPALQERFDRLVGKTPLSLEEARGFAKDLLSSDLSPDDKSRLTVVLGSRVTFSALDALLPARLFLMGLADLPLPEWVNRVPDARPLAEGRRLRAEARLGEANPLDDPLAAGSTHP
jgi:hypothetical protein